MKIPSIHNRQFPHRTSLLSGRNLGLVTAVLVVIGMLSALSAAQQLQFEVASVKPDDPNARVQVTNHQPVFAGDRVRASSTRVLDMILYAYNVRPFQVSG